MEVSQSVLSIVLTGFVVATSWYNVVSKSKKDAAMKLLRRLKLSKHAGSRTPKTPVCAFLRIVI